MHNFLGISKEEYQKRQKGVEQADQDQKDFLKQLELKYRLKWSKKKGK